DRPVPVRGAGPAALHPPLGRPRPGRARRAGPRRHLPAQAVVRGHGRRGASRAAVRGGREPVRRLAALPRRRGARGPPPRADHAAGHLRRPRPQVLHRGADRARRPPARPRHGDAVTDHALHRDEPRAETAGEPVRYPMYGPEFARDPHAVYARMRADGHGDFAPVELAPGVPATLVLGYETALEILRDPDRFPRCSEVWEERVGPECPVLPMMRSRPNALFTNGAVHARLRAVVVDSLNR